MDFEISQKLEGHWKIRLSDVDALETMTKDEKALVRSLGKGRLVSQVVEKAALPAPVAMAILNQLYARGAVVKVAEDAPRAPEAQPARPSPAAGTVGAGSFFDSAEGLDAATKKSLADLEARMESTDLFALLEVPRGSDVETVRRGFYELSRRFHPDRFAGRTDSLTVRRIEEIFAHLTQAHQTLCDPTLRERYLSRFPQYAKPEPAPVQAAPRTVTDPMMRALMACDVSEEATPAPASTPPAPVAPGSMTERRQRLMRNPLMRRQQQRMTLIRNGREAFAAGNFMVACLNLEAAARCGVLDPETQAILDEARAKTPGRKR